MCQPDWEQIAKHYYHVAVWFMENEPGTPVPDWCFLSWPVDVELLTELIQQRIEELGE